MKKVFIAGGASYDSIIYLENFPGAEPRTIHHCKFNETVGSTGTGKALNLCRLGFDVVLHASIGKDLYGKKIKEALNQPHLSFIYNYDPAGTERHTNLMNSDGQRISIFTHNLTEYPRFSLRKLIPYIEKADYVIINLGNYTKKLLPVAHEMGKIIWTDLHDYNGVNPWYDEYIAYAQRILLSSDNLPNYRQWMQKMVDKGKDWIVTTHGSQGSTGLLNTGQWFEVKALKTLSLVDSNGAGDAYFSGFLYAFDRGYNLEKCMQAGTIAGAMCINSSRLYHPDLSEKRIEQYLKEAFTQG